MKRILTTCLLGSVFVSTLAAQGPPRLALAKVELSALLGAKIAGGEQGGAESPQRTDAFVGEWKGTLRLRKAIEVRLSVSKTSDNKYRAEWTGGDDGSRPVTGVEGSFFEGTGDGLKVSWMGRRNDSVFLTGQIDASAGTIDGRWINNKAAKGFRNVPIVLTRVAPRGSAPSSDSRASTAHELARAVDVKMFDQFSKEGLFALLDSAELNDAAFLQAAGNGGAPSSATKASMEALKKVDADYLLLTRVESFQDQTLEMRRSKSLHFEAQNFNLRRRPGVVSSTGVQVQGGIDPEVWKRQIVGVTLRCQLFETGTGRLLRSDHVPISLHRDYLVVAQGMNQLSQNDLIEAVAEKAADWAALLVDDEIFPITALAKEGDSITLNRGSEAGIKKGQIFSVSEKGADLKDANGTSLGSELKTVGRVMVTEVQSRYAKAKILEDTGISVGCVLTRKQKN